MEGCGAQFHENDPAIVNQEVGKKPNPRIFDLTNTIDKMAQKRAFVGAVKAATAVSNFFHEDLQVIDMVGQDHDTEIIEAEATPAPQSKNLMKELSELIDLTGFQAGEVKQLANDEYSKSSARDLDEEELEHICWLLILMYGERHYGHLPEKSAALLEKIKDSQPGITYPNLFRLANTTFPVVDFTKPPKKERGEQVTDPSTGTKVSIA